MSDKALSGLKVIEYGQFYSAAYCAKLMGDLGAEVIKVEPPEGDESRRHGPFPDDIPHPEKSGLFLYLNANKLGITLNVRNAKGRQMLLDLLKRSDVFVENNPPKVMAELGLDYPSLSRLSPSLIVTSITPYGQTGPYRDWKGYDINSSGLGGISYSVGDPQREPLNLPVSQSHVQGAVHAASATMVALLARQATGKGQHVDVAEANVWAAFHGGQGVYSYVFEGRVRKRSGHRTPGFYPYTILPCKDGYVSMIAGRGHQWKRFLELVGGGEVPEWYSRDPRFRDRLEMSWKYANELDSLLAPWLMKHTKKEIFNLCQERRIPFTPVNTIEEVVNEPHLNDRGFFVEINHPGAGRFKYPGPPYRLSETPWRVERPAPLLGEHNEEIYCKRLGYSREELIRLRGAGII